MLDYLVIIQARVGSTRFPNKVLQTVGGIPMVKRVWLAAKKAVSNWHAKVIVAWPERYADLDENNVLERFQRISNEFPSANIIRLTADCPLLTSRDIVDAVNKFNGQYYNNHIDGKDVQIFPSLYLWNRKVTDKEHVIKDKPNTGGCSVNTRTDLAIARLQCKGR